MKTIAVTVLMSLALLAAPLAHAQETPAVKNAAPEKAAEKPAEKPVEKTAETPAEKAIVPSTAVPGPAAAQAAKGAAKISKPILDNDPDLKKASKAPAKTQPTKTADVKTAKIDKKAVSTPAIVTKVNYIGEIETYKARADDTLQTIGEREGLGYVELRAANPSMDPWRPGAGKFVILPKMHLLPDAPHKGIVINLPEMRLYYYQANGKIVSFPIGVGKEGFSTPNGTTQIERKAKGPTWRPTARMLREDPTLKPMYGPGPDNPLGAYALYLGWPEYRLHGNNKPWSIGRRVSSGCIRMFNSDVEYLYDSVPNGTSVTTIRQPIKFAWIGDMLYLEAHPDGMLADQMERGSIDYKVPPELFADLSRVAGNARDNIDWKAVREAVRDRRGYPIPILQGASEDQKFVTAEVIERAGTTRNGNDMVGVPTDATPPVVVTPTVTPAAATAPAKTDKPAFEPLEPVGEPDADALKARERRRSNGYNG